MIARNQRLAGGRQPAAACKETEHPVMNRRDHPELTHASRAERRVGARLFDAYYEVGGPAVVAHGTAATGGTASSLLPDRHDSTRDKAPAHHSFSQGPRFFTIEWGLLCLSKWPRPATATDPVQPRVARIFAYGHSGEPVPVAPRAAPGPPAQDRNVALTCAFGAPGRIRTRDPLLRRYGPGIARRCCAYPDEQFFLLAEAGYGLRWPDACIQWLPKWLPGILLAELTSERTSLLAGGHGRPSQPRPVASTIGASTPSLGRSQFQARQPTCYLGSLAIARRGPPSALDGLPIRS